MAAQVLSGSGNVTYTNSTGQNVRLVINYFEVGTLGYTAEVSFPGCSITVQPRSTYGKTLAFQTTNGSVTLTSSMSAQKGIYGASTLTPIPLEIALANGDTFSINASTSTHIAGYNMIIIPEAGYP